MLYRRATSRLSAETEKGKNELPIFELTVPEQVVKAADAAAFKVRKKRR